MMKAAAPHRKNPAQSFTERIALHILSSWEKGTHTLDFLLRRELRRYNLPPSEKARITDWVSNWGRGRGAARYLLENRLVRGLESLPPEVRRRLELSVCQLLYEERTPKPILVSRTTESIKEKFGRSLGNLANAVLREIAENPGSWPDSRADLVSHLAYSTSHPLWIVERWLARWDEQRTRAQLQWDNRRPIIWLRWNLVRGDEDAAASLLYSRGVEFEKSPEFVPYYRLKSSFYPRAAELVKSGYFSVQDPSASLSVRLVNPRPDTDILDLCAAPGGKTSLMAQMTADRARITAVDSSRDRLRQLKESLIAASISTVRVLTSDARSLTENPQVSLGTASFDAVLVDVPCSGLGVLARRADLRWRRKPEDIPQLVHLQKDLIRAGGALTRPGGTLVYSTCSVEPEENEEIVADFLRDNAEFSLDDSRIDVPDRLHVGPGQVATDSPRDGIDGIYAARFIRTSNQNEA